MECDVNKFLVIIIILIKLEKGLKNKLCYVFFLVINWYRNK